MQCESCVPGLGNDPIRSLFGWQIMRKGDQRIGAFGADGLIAGNANTLFINAPFDLSELPVFSF